MFAPPDVNTNDIIQGAGKLGKNYVTLGEGEGANSTGNSIQSRVDKLILFHYKHCTS